MSRLLDDSPPLIRRLFRPGWLVLACASCAFGAGDDPAPATGELEAPASIRGDDEPRRVRIRDEDGHISIARLHGNDAAAGVVLLPDGRLAWTHGDLAYTREPFVPIPADALEASLAAREYAGFEVERTSHYLVFSRASGAFTRASACLLESLYGGLTEQLRAKGFPVRDAEFPLVAVIFRTEDEFRAHDSVPPDVQAYYNVVTNRIYLYEHSKKDAAAPDVAAMRRPQTVAHEGTHQILQNTDVQPRLASWPPWLVEGLAEYFAPASVAKDGEWDGANRVNPFHMATLRDLKDPLTFQREEAGLDATRLKRPGGASTVAYLLTREKLDPTDYALSWALTYYLANKRFPQLLAYMKELSGRPPLQPATPEQHLADFRRHFPEDPAKMDQSINRFLAGLKGFEALPSWAVTFEQPIGRGITRRAVIVSQSPAMIRQWVGDMCHPEGGPILWKAYPFQTRARARLMAEQWLNGP